MSTKPNIKPSKIEHYNSLRITGLSTTCIFGEDTLEASALWQEFGTIAPSISAINKTVAYGLCFDINNSKGLEYVCGIEVPDNVQESDLPRNLVLKNLPSLTYAAFKHDGHVSVIRQTCDAIWKEWFPQSGYKKPGNANFFFERYGENFDPQKGIGGIEIWIPVEK